MEIPAFPWTKVLSSIRLMIWKIGMVTILFGKNANLPFKLRPSLILLWVRRCYGSTIPFVGSNIFLNLLTVSGLIRGSDWRCLMILSDMGHSLKSSLKLCPSGILSFNYCIGRDRMYRIVPAAASAICYFSCFLL